FLDQLEFNLSPGPLLSHRTSPFSSLGSRPSRRGPRLPDRSPFRTGELFLVQEPECQALLLIEPAVPSPRSTAGRRSGSTEASEELPFDGAAAPGLLLAISVSVRCPGPGRRGLGLRPTGRSSDD